MKGPLTRIAQHIKGKMYDIEELVAANQGIEALVSDDMAQFPNLHSLYIPHNRLKVLNSLEKNYRLSFLDARDNQLVDFDLSKQLHMRELYLSGNQLQGLETVLEKLSHMSDLQTLDLRGNPATLEKGYRAAVVARFITLKVLDGLEVEKAERAKKVELQLQTSHGNRTSSLMQYLTTRPLSAADAIVRRRSEDIRKKRQLQKQQDEERQTAVARRRREEFEEAARRHRAPLCDAVLRGIPSRPVEEVKSEQPRRPMSRLFLKVPHYTQNEGLEDAERVLVHHSPDLPNVFRRRLTEKIVFAK
jgi:hypothetical protein